MRDLAIDLTAYRSTSVLAQSLNRGARVDRVNFLCENITHSCKQTSKQPVDSLTSKV